MVSDMGQAQNRRDFEEVGFGDDVSSESRGNAMAEERAAVQSPEQTGRLSHGAKVKRGQLNAVQQGRYGTGPAPYGYRRGREGERPLVVDDREAEVVRIIFREYLNTRSTGKVVNYLHSKSIFTRKGNKWSRQAIAIILSNRTYRGRVSYGEVETQGLHEPIIEPALFYKANALREKKKRKRGEDDNGEAED
jgi:site-specific DNA recombinase